MPQYDSVPGVQYTIVQQGVVRHGAAEKFVQSARVPEVGVEYSTRYVNVRPAGALLHAAPSAL